jgi:lysophospholipase L1-like esterase
MLITLPRPQATCQWMYSLCFLAAVFPSAQAAEPTYWVGSWACAPVRQPVSDKTSYSEVTIRNVIHTSLGGDGLRIKISNEFGTSPLMIEEADVAMSEGDDKVRTQTRHRITFGGVETVIIPAGALAVSDPVEMSVPSLADLAISVFLPKQALPLLSYHPLASSTAYMADGNQASAAELQHSTMLKSGYLVTGVDVRTPLTSSAVVTLGDSITDGAHSTPNRNARWPDVLAARLHAKPETSQIGVLNEGISGNRVLHDGAGSNALARLDRDVLAQSGVRYLIILESINDIRYATNQRGPEDAATVPQIIWALQQISIRAHSRGLKVYCGTILPFGGSKNANNEGEQMRHAINEWIRKTNTFDAVVDFDLAAHDPAHEDQFSPANDSGDHLHLNDAGYKAMADSIDLKLFQ